VAGSFPEAQAAVGGLPSRALIFVSRALLDSDNGTSAAQTADEMPGDNSF
jgi:hypothetical protein